MVVDQPVSIVIGYIIAGIAGGFISSWLSVNASGEKFDMRKHGNALITGAIAGIVFGIAAILKVSESEEVETAADITIGMFLTFLASLGIDKGRANVSKMIAKRSTEEQAKTATTTPPAVVAPATTTTKATTTLPPPSPSPAKEEPPPPPPK